MGECENTCRNSIWKLKRCLLLGPKRGCVADFEVNLTETYVRVSSWIHLAITTDVRLLWNTVKTVGFIKRL